MGNVFRVLESSMCMTESKTDCRQTDRQTDKSKEAACQEQVMGAEWTKFLWVSGSLELKGPVFCQVST